MLAKIYEVSQISESMRWIRNSEKNICFGIEIKTGGGQPAFCRSLQQIGQCGSGIKRPKISKN